jgi:outer membrane protein assembly factor BamE (lipoprotein component of BamABCDE complex)
MRKILIAALALSFALTSCSDDDDNNGGGNNNVPNNYSGTYNGDLLFVTTGTFGDETFTENSTMIVHKDADGHYIWAVNLEETDSTKAYFNKNGYVKHEESLNQLGTVTSITLEAQYVSGNKMEVDGLQVIEVPAAQVELSRTEISGIMNKQ